MALPILLIVLVAAALAFHFWSPWWLTPLASNWRQMDDTLNITLAITGVAFVAVNLFVAWAIFRYRHRDGHRAAYEPHNRRLEAWLIGITTVGIAAMLAPGLFVYAKLIDPPRDAHVVEVVGQQWQWRFRLPGPDGRLGSSDPSYVSATNPLGLNPRDPANQDNRIVDAPELHLLVGQPVKLLLRAKDVLHDFYVPPFRTRMNMVPGMVTQMWLTPTRTGRFDILCAQLCGVGHASMRGVVVVDEKPAYDAWVAQLPTFAALQAKQATQAEQAPPALAPDPLPVSTPASVPVQSVTTPSDLMLKSAHRAAAVVLVAASASASTLTALPAFASAPSSVTTTSSSAVPWQLAQNSLLTPRPPAQFAPLTPSAPDSGNSGAQRPSQPARRSGATPGLPLQNDPNTTAPPLAIPPRQSTGPQSPGPAQPSVPMIRTTP